MKTIAIYHKHCTDGTTAAAVVLKKYPDALVFPMSHGYSPEEIAPILIQANPGDQIFTVDCVMGAREFLDAGYKVTSIDHHADQEVIHKQLEKENPNFTYVFNDKKSGASLSWEYFFPNEPTPELVKLVEDRDLWNWKYSPETDNLTNRLWMFDDQPEKILKIMSGPLDDIKKEGSVISGYNKALIDMTIKDIEPLMLQIGPYKVATYNVTMFRSEIGHELCEIRKETVGLFTVESHEVCFSFRGNGKFSPTAVEIAHVLGGGGHRNAAGARMKLEDFIKAII